MISTDIHDILKRKTELLCKGAYLDKSLIQQYKSKGLEFAVRKGGAGPLGGRYFLFEDGQTLVNVMLWSDKKVTNLTLRPKDNDTRFEVYDEREKNHCCDLIHVLDPTFYGLKTSEGIPMKKIALVHGVDCLATTVYQKCKYWACGEACKFCGIELSLKYDTTIVEKSPAQLAEVMNAAKKENRCAHVTLTTGSEEDEKGVQRYVETCSMLKKAFPEVPLHIQIEPVQNLDLLSDLKKSGADTIGIHIEILDDFLRKIVLPGKCKKPIQLYRENWKRAVEIFGKNQVESFILMGFGESPEDFIEELEKLIQLGVIPYITPVRAVPGVKPPMPITNHNMLLEVYNKAAKMMKNHDVNPLKHLAGCVRCGGCSAIVEAYKAV